MIENARKMHEKCAGKCAEMRGKIARKIIGDPKGKDL
jgi:hypothetical protein